MSSRRTEDAHLTMISKILSETGLVCVRSPLESMKSISIEEEEEIESIKEEEQEKPEEQHPEEETLSEEEDISEVKSQVFPTPSLRKVLPDKLREIERHNRIRVLPDEFKTGIDPDMIPKIASTPQQKYIEVLAELTGCKMYNSNLAEYWFLDTLANLLRRGQEDGMNKQTQVLLILWFCEWMKEMQHFDAADRQRMLQRFKDNMLAAARFVAEVNRVPNPEEAGVFFKVRDLPPAKDKSSHPLEETKQMVTFEGAPYECSLRDLAMILHYVFDLFSTDYQYNLVRSVFTFTPEYVLIDAPYKIETPKVLYAPLKNKPKKEKAEKKDAKAAKGKKKEVDTEEYLALMELKAREEKELEEIEERDREAWNRRSHILPLNFAVDEEFFNKYWTAPILELEPESEPKVKAKGRK